MDLSLELTQQGVAALKAGDKTRAYSLLAQALQHNPQNDQAWLWLSGAVTTDAERRYCLERVTEITPEHTTARRGLNNLPAVPSVNPLPSASVSATKPSASAVPTTPPAPTRPTRPSASAVPATLAVADPAVSADAVADPLNAPAMEPKSRQVLPHSLTPIRVSEDTLSNQPAITPGKTTPHNTRATVTPKANTDVHPDQPRTLLDILRESAASEPDSADVAPKSTTLAERKLRLPRSRKRKKAVQSNQEDYIYYPGQRTGKYRVVERVGIGPQHELYLIRESDPKWLFWMLVSDLPLDPSVMKAAQKPFTNQGWQHLVAPVAATPVSFLLRILPGVRFPCIGKRWVSLARQLGYNHSIGDVYQRRRVFSLDTIQFAGEGHVAPVSYEKPVDPAMSFTAPEVSEGRLSPASDVYVLGASLLALLGEQSPSVVFDYQDPVVGPALKQRPRLYDLLRRATDLRPERRHKNGNEFADALAKLLAEEPREVTVGAWRPSIRQAAILLTVSLMMTLIMLVAWHNAREPESSQVSLTTDADILLADIVTNPSALQITSLNLEFTPPAQVAMHITIEYEGEPVDPDTVLTFEVWHNTRPITGLQQHQPEPAHYQLTFSREKPAGIYEVQVGSQGSQATRRVFFDPTLTMAELEELGIGGIQADTSQYPQIDIYFGVIDENGEAARLEGDFDIQVFQDGESVEQFVMNPVDPTTEPLAVALAIDVSGSMYGEPLTAAREAAAEFVRQLEPNDTVCLYIFATLVQQVGRCTIDKSTVIEAISNLETIDDTALHDALIRVASDLNQRPGRKAVVLLSDGADTRSNATFDTALTIVRESNIPVYSVGLLSEQFDGAPLERIAQESNGIYKLTPHPEEMQELYNQIRLQLENQYVVTFRSIFADRREGTVTIRIQRNEWLLEISRPFVVS